VTDKIRSSATDDLCSLELERDIGHGARKTRETTTFDQKKGEATRTTVFPLGGGTSTLSFAGCPRDAMAFLYFARRELGQGRVAPPQQVFFGSAYSVRMEYTGAQTITASDKPAVTDRLVVNVKGPKSSFSLEMFFARDAARTPLLIRVPLSEGLSRWNWCAEMRVAFFSPLPPARSGIADYSQALIQSLKPW